MTPKLTYTATVQPNGDVTIVLQSFTHERASGMRTLFTAYNGVHILSDSYPNWYPPCSLCTQGRNADLDDALIHIPAADWPRVEQALDEYGAVQTNAERAEEAKVYQVIETDTTFDVGGPYGCALVARLEKRAGCTRADADELCAKLTARADAERKATEVRVDYVDNGVHLYIGDRKWPNCCVGFSCGDGDGITKDQADQLAAATAEALRGILRGDRK